MKKTGTILTIIAAAAFGAAAAFAQDPPSEERLAAGASTNELVAYALAKNPKVTIAREEWHARVESSRVAGGPPDPEFMVEQMGFTDPVWQARITQMVPFPGKLGAAEDASAKNAEAARYLLDATARDLAVSIREEAAEIAYLQTALKIADGNGELLERLSALSQSSYAENRAELIDLVRAKAETAKVAYDREVLAELLAVEKEKLNALLAREPLAKLGPVSFPPPAPLAYTSAEVVAFAAERPEELKAAGADIERMNLEVRMAKLERLPDFTLAAFKNPIIVPDDMAEEESYGVAVGFTLPIWFSKNNGRVAAAEAQVRRAEAMRAMTRNELRSEARELYFRAANSAKLVALYSETLIPQARRSLELAETYVKGNEAGLASYAEVLTSIYGFELALARAQADNAKYLARLERLAGKSLTVREAAGEAAK